MKKKIAAITVLVMVALLCEAGCIGTNIGNPSSSETKALTRRSFTSIALDDYAANSRRDYK